MRNLKSIKAFITAHRKERTPSENKVLNDELACDLALLDGIEHFRAIDGFYDGHYEETFVCFLNIIAYANANEGGDLVQALVDLGASYQQDGVLIVWGDDAAELYECREPFGSLFLGTFQRVAKPEPHEDHSFDPLDGSFYVVR